jgi:TfoX/Sxy family transcriptional regulator of competence genes
MASELSFVEFVVEQMESAGAVSYRKMFGEYAVYCTGKLVALICDNQLFVKPTDGGRAYMGNVVEAPPYPGAKSYFLIEENLEDPEWMSALIKLTAQELPLPQPKKKKTKGTDK